MHNNSAIHQKFIRKMVNSRNVINNMSTEINLLLIKLFFAMNNKLL